MQTRRFDTMLLRDLVDRLDVSLSDDHGRDLGLDAGLPIALLPVRLEARFAGVEGAGRTLRVRIIPDDIHIPTLETGISPQEASLANAYRDAAGEEARARAWEALVAVAGSSTSRVLRAAWLASRADESEVSPQPRPPLTARGLPDSWFVVAYSGDQLVASASSAQVVPELVVDPAAGAEPGAWMTDFSVAVDSGMGVVLDVGTASIDVLLAVGVRGGQDGGAGTQELSEILDAQRFSRDVDLLAPGTATNNSPAERATWRSVPPVAEIRRRETAAPVGSDAPTDGRALSSALGLAAAIPALSRPLAAGGTEQRDAAAMMDLLWPITGGELLTTMLSGLDDKADLGQGVVEAVRTHASRYVRGRGPLPTLLIGRQPYGVLPALSLARWVPEDATLAGLHKRLLTGWSLWEDAVGRLTRLGGANGERSATQIIAELMCQSPVPDPLGYKATTVLPPNYSLIADLSFRGTLDGDITAGMLQLPWLPVLAITAEDHQKVGSVVLPAVDPAGGESLRSLPTGGIVAIAAALQTDVGHPDLLSQLAKRSLLRAGERAASYVGLSIADHLGLSETATAIRGSLRSDLGSSQSPSTLSFAIKDFRQDTLPNFAHTTIGELTDNPDLFQTIFPELTFTLPPRSPERSAAVAAIETLSSLSAERLELLLGETLDVFSNRYDAWVTSLATRRLSELRQKRPEGIHLGAFGWLVDLESETDQNTSAGHVLAPSPAHAATAAVLRNADIDDRAASIDTSKVARRFDITSSSVRIARGILEAVGHGQPLSAVLGYRIERFLQDAGFIDAIPVLREAFRTFGGERPDSTEAAEAIPAHDVVDGVAVWSALDNNAVVTGLSSDARKALDPFLFLIMDVLSDLLVAEGVHQLIRGDRTRAGATITALSRGLPVPTELRVAQSPGRHLSVPVQLLMATRAGTVPTHAGWAGDRPRALVAPAAERLARSILPDPAECGLLVEIRDPAKTRTETIPLASLGLCALDVLAEVGTDDEQSELATRVRFAIGEAAASGRMLAAAAPGSTVGWGALTAVARAWARVFGSARPFLPGDIVIGPEKDAQPAPPPDSAALSAATSAASSQVELLVAATAELQSRLEELGSTTPDAGFVTRVSSALDAFRAAGLAGTGQEPGSDPVGVLGLVQRCIAAGVSATQRWQRRGADAATEHPGVAGRPGADDVSERTERVVSAVRDIFGEVVVVAPAVKADGLAVSVADAATALPSSDDLADWIGELSEVRTPARRWWQAVLATEALTRRAAPLLPTQLPKGTGDWIGGFAGQQIEWHPPFGARRAFVTHVPEPFTGSEVSALVVESWLEQVPISFEEDPHARLDSPEGDAGGDPLPGYSEPSGVATHYNAAGARPPQSILLAVAPDPAATTWHLGDLIATILETLELSRFRAIEPSTDLPTRAVLPAVFVPDGIAGLSFPRQIRDRLDQIDELTVMDYSRRFGNE